MTPIPYLYEIETDDLEAARNSAPSHAWVVAGTLDEALATARDFGLVGDLVTARRLHAVVLPADLVCALEAGKNAGGKGGWPDATLAVVRDLILSRVATSGTAWGGRLVSAMRMDGLLDGDRRGVEAPEPTQGGNAVADGLDDVHDADYEYYKKMDAQAAELVPPEASIKAKTVLGIIHDAISGDWNARRISSRLLDLLSANGYSHVCLASLVEAVTHKQSFAILNLLDVMLGRENADDPKEGEPR